jgi:hypothetical protein
MSNLESDVVAKVKAWCEKNGVLYIKFTPFGSKGWPDTILIFPDGFHLWTELKRMGKVPRKLQLHRIKQLTLMGALAVWFDNWPACEDYLQDCLDSALETINEMVPVEAPKPEDLKPGIILPFNHKEKKDEL